MGKIVLRQIPEDRCDFYNYGTRENKTWHLGREFGRPSEQRGRIWRLLPQGRLETQRRWWKWSFERWGRATCREPCKAAGMPLGGGKASIGTYFHFNTQLRRFLLRLVPFLIVFAILAWKALIFPCYAVVILFYMWINQC